MGFRPRSNVRRKQRVVADSDEEDDIDITKHIAKAKAKTHAAQPSARAPTKLSFGDDDDTDIILKKKKKKSKARGISTLDLDGTEVQAAGSSYSAATLADLKDQTPQMPSKHIAQAGAQSREGGLSFTTAMVLAYNSVVMCAQLLLRCLLIKHAVVRCRASRIQNVRLIQGEI